MFTTFFQELKAAKLPVTLTEYLLLMRALDADIAEKRVEDFYYLARTALVKDERNLDTFDQVFGSVFNGLDLMSQVIEADIPAEWLQALTERFLSDDEKAQIEALGGWDKIMEELKKRLEEQKEAHHGGKKWIGAGGTSPFGALGYNPAGIRIGQQKNRSGRAIKVWDKREYKDLDGGIELRHAEYQAGAAAVTQVRPTGCGRRARPRHHDQENCAQRAISISSFGPSGATPSRC